MTTASAHTPPLGFAALTPLYDRAIAALTREGSWRTSLARHLAARPGESIIDVGCGTGSLAGAVTTAEPGCAYRGIDPDEAAVEIARAKAQAMGSSASFTVGTFGAPGESDRADAIVSSLVLHQVPAAEKRRLLGAMFDALKPGGRLLIADYGLQRGLQRLAFRCTVQLLDGKADTQPNADGVLPALIAGAGFEHVRRLERFATPTGSIEIWEAKR